MDRLPDLSSRNMKTEVDSLVSRMAEKDMEVIAVNMRHPALDIPALYVIMPGAQLKRATTEFSVGFYTAKFISESGPPDRVLERLKEMDALVPGTYYIPYHEGMVHEAEGNWERALELHETALERLRKEDPAHHFLYDIYCRLTGGFARLGRFEDALATATQAEAVDGTRLDICNLLAPIHVKLRQYPAAVACYERILAEGEEAARSYTYVNLASVYSDMENMDRAAACCRLALALDREVLDKLAVMYRRQGKSRKAFHLTGLAERLGVAS